MLHPDFYTDAKILRCEPLARLLFTGLWGLADREGRLEFDPLELKIRLLPADNCEIEPLITQLEASSLVFRYDTGTHEVIQVRGFTKRQKPHPKEAKSTIPAPTYAPEPARAGKLHGEPGNYTASRAVSKSVSKSESVLETYVEQARLELVSKEPEPKKPVDVVFEYWQKAAKHPRAILDTKRQARIQKQLDQGRTVSDLKLAIDGCLKTPYNMGENDAHAKYDDIELICRDASHVEKFMRNASNTSQPVRGAQCKTI